MGPIRREVSGGEQIPRSSHRNAGLYVSTFHSTVLTRLEDILTNSTSNIGSKTTCLPLHPLYATCL